MEFPQLQCAHIGAVAENTKLMLILGKSLTGQQVATALLVG